jgi:hypothetical protein
MTNNIEYLRHSHCWTDYRVTVEEGTLDVHAWAIVGGTLAVSTLDYYFTKRLNYCAERDSSGGRFPDPAYRDAVNWKKWDGVHIEHFTNGADDIYAYARATIPRLTLQLQREAELPESPIYSPRFHDLGNMCYFQCTWEPRRYFSPITASSKYYGGRCEAEIEQYANKVWKKSYSILNPLFDKYFHTGVQYLADLPEDEWLEYLHGVCTLRLSQGRRIIFDTF